MPKLKNSNLALIAVMLFALTILSCEREVQRSSKADNLMEEVMAIHDSVMPKMSDLRKTRKALMDKAEALDDSVLAKNLLRQADRIDSAQKAMMSWMRQFNPTYYEDQKELIKEVKDLMENSLSEGKELLD